MAITFPAAPINGQQFTAGDITYEWDTVKWGIVRTPMANVAKMKYPLLAALASVAGVVTIDLSSNVELFNLTLTENVTSWVFQNPPAASHYIDKEILVTQDAAIARTIVTPATAGMTAGGAWTVDATLSSKQLLGIRVFSDSTVHLLPSGVYG